MVGLPIPEWGLVTLNDIEMDAPGRIGLNSYVLTDGHPPPEEQGAARRRRRARIEGPQDARSVQFEVFLDGRWDADGDPTDTSDALAVIAAVQSHILYLRTAILDDDGDAEGCVDCVVTSAIPGTTHEGPVQVDDLVADPGIGAQVVTFDLTIIRGDLAIVAGS
jgi:hypothetical protein